MEHLNRIELRLPHRVDVSEIASHLLGPLGCDAWVVVCHHEHLLVLHLSQGDRLRYAVQIECTTPLEKAIFHGSKACALSIIALSEGNTLSPEQIADLKARLSHLQ